MIKNMYINRVLPIKKELTNKSILLLGPIRTGKSFLIEKEIKPDKVF